MSRLGIALLLLGAAAIVGCRMCAHPYDYAGPVMDGQCESCGVPGGRAGSILSPGVQPVGEVQLPPGAAGVEVPAAAQSGVPVVVSVVPEVQARRTELFRWPPCPAL